LTSVLLWWPKVPILIWIFMVCKASYLFQLDLFFYILKSDGQFLRFPSKELGKFDFIKRIEGLRYRRCQSLICFGYFFFFLSHSSSAPLYFLFRAFVFFSSPIAKELVNHIKRDSSVLSRIGALREVIILLLWNLFLS